MSYILRSLTRLLAYTVPFMPFVALAQGAFGGIGTFMGNLLGFINQYVIPFIFAIALVVFLWGLFTYFIRGGGSAAEAEAGRSLMLWGLIGFVVMVSVWGIVNLLASGLGLGAGQGLQYIPPAPGGTGTGGSAAP